MTAAEPAVERVFALTPLQEGLLVDSLAAPEASLYLEQIVLDLPGDISVRAMAGAWRAAVARHAILRTSFHWRDLERPLQVVHRAAIVPIVHQDLSRLAAQRRAEAVHQFLEQDKAQLFAFDRPPLLRLAVLRHGAHRHQLVVTLHHILLDGWSLGILMTDVARLYTSLAAGATPRLEPPPAFADYVAWIGAQDPGAAERYWRRELGDFAGAPPLARRRRGHAHDHRELEVELTAAETGAARARARAQRITLNTIVLVAWSAVLAAELGTDDVVVGAVVSGREAPVRGIEGMVGLCINTVPVRVRVAAERRADVLLAELHARQLEQREFQYCSLTAVHGWSGMPHDRPLFESIFIFENHAAGGGGYGRARAFERTGYPLTVIVSIDGNLRIRILYDAAVVEPEVAARLAGRVREVVGALAGDAERPLGEVAHSSTLETADAFERHAV
jgi:hypothetical protein